MSEPAEDRTQEKRRRIIDAARFLVLRNGLRGTTMEAIAREAQIAKPTLYAQFPDKDAVFAGIVDGLMDELLAAYRAGMGGKGDLADRIGDAMGAQFAVLARVLEGSPHAGELMSEHKRVNARFREKDLMALDEIAAALAEAGVDNAADLAELAMAACYGISLKMADQAKMVAGIKLACRRLIGPELPDSQNV